MSAEKKLYKINDEHPPYITSSLLSHIPSISHGFFTRKGGVSAESFYSLNTSFNKKDPHKNVEENRLRICNAFGLKKLFLCSQAHTSSAHILTEETIISHPPIGDAIVTPNRDILIGIQTADCVPLLLLDPFAHIIAACHAGWKGAATGIVDNTIQAMIALGAEPDTIIAALGPCIRQESYEIKKDFFNGFNEPIDSFIEEKENCYFFDVPGYVKSLLKKNGVKNIDDLLINTFTDEENFFSYRRSSIRKEPEFGVQLSVIALRL